MDRRVMIAVAAAVYGVAVIVAFLAGTPRIGIIVAIVGAMVLSLVFRQIGVRGPTAGGTTRDRARR